MPTGADTTPNYGTTVLTLERPIPYWAGTIWFLAPPTILGRCSQPNTFDGSGDTPYVLATTARIDATSIGPSRWGRDRPPMHQR